jgi:hypothetical protein
MLNLIHIKIIFLLFERYAGYIYQSRLADVFVYLYQIHLSLLVKVNTQKSLDKDILYIYKSNHGHKEKHYAFNCLFLSFLPQTCITQNNI